ncbi:hypothetical protein CF327_g3141, partial [Tilletia walkeri]
GNRSAKRLSLATDSGESIIRIAESVRERDVNIINTSCVPTTPIGESNTPDSSLMELLIIIHACRVASACSEDYRCHSACLRLPREAGSEGQEQGVDFCHIGCEHDPEGWLRPWHYDGYASQIQGFFDVPVHKVCPRFPRLAPHLHAAPEKHGIAVVSVDYRLELQARMPSILSDISDALQFLQSPKVESSAGGKLDTSRIAVSGCSVGGWLALLVGSRHDFEACGVKAPPLDSIRRSLPSTRTRSQVLRTIYRSRISILSPLRRKERWHGQTILKVLWILRDQCLLSRRQTHLGPNSKFYSYMVQGALLPQLLLDGTQVKADSAGIADGIRAGTIKSILYAFLTRILI